MSAASGERSIEETARVAQTGCRAAFCVLVDTFEDPLFRFLLVRTGNRSDAEELVQDAFLRAWDRIETYDPARPFQSWLFTIAARLAVSRARRPRIATTPVDVSAPLVDGFDPADRVEQRDEERNVWRMAAEVLTPEQRGALWLRYAHDLDNADVARILGKSTVATRVLVHRARKRLACHLEDLPTQAEPFARECNEPRAAGEREPQRRRPHIGSPPQQPATATGLDLNL